MSNGLANNYNVLHLLGEGGMAQVYLAEKGNLGKKVALKVLRKEFLLNNHIRGRFLAKAKNLIQLNHPNIVGVNDLIDEADFVAIELEYIEGLTLKQHLEQKGALPNDEIQRLFEQMLNAVQYIHRMGFVHRDIKPSNFMLLASGVIKLTDFGIAKNMDAMHSDYTGTGTVLGTPKYMSPEQVRNTKDVTAQSDIYSLGVVLWEMVTGRLPYDINTESAFDVFEKIVRQPLEKTGTKWDGIIEKATLKEVGGRKIVFPSNDLNQEHKNETSFFLKNRIYILMVLLVGVLSSVYFFTQEEKPKNLIVNEPETLPQWELDFNEQWELLVNSEIDKENEQNLRDFSELYSSLPKNAIDQKTKVNDKIEHYRLIIDETGKQARREKKEVINEQPATVELSDNNKRGTFTDARDGKTYKWVKIGDQVWMAENLAYRPNSGVYWDYDNNESDISRFGLLYDWKTACQVCPKGWHLPSDSEFMTLTNYLGGVNTAGKKLKSTSGWNEYGNGNNSSGFDAKPAGSIDHYNRNAGKGNYLILWTRSEGFSQNFALIRNITFYERPFNSEGIDIESAASVRCIKN